MKKDVFNLTTPQISVYLSEQFDNSPIYNIVGTMYFKNDIDLTLLKEAVNLTVKNNQAMRIGLVKKLSKVSQFFKDFEPFKISVHDFSNKTMQDFKDFQLKYSQKVFDVFEDDLYSFTICNLPNSEVALIGKFHHLIADAWSLGLVIDNIATNYTYLSNNRDVPADPTASNDNKVFVNSESSNNDNTFANSGISNDDVVTNSGLYSDFIKRENDYLESNSYEKNKEFWENSLADLEPISLKDSSSNSFKANRLAFDFSKEETNLIDSFCKDNHISAYVLFLTVLNLYLYKTTTYDSFTVQTPVLNRLGKEKNTVGMFINMISVPFEGKDSIRVSDLLQKTAHKSLSLFKNAKFPYMHLLENFRKKKLGSQNYNVVFSFQNMRPKKEIPNLVHYRAEWNFVNLIKEQLAINITDVDNSGVYHISYDYRTDLFTETEISWMNKRMRTILFDIMKNPDNSVADIEVLPEEEKELLLNDFNDSNFDYDSSKTLVDLFEEAVNNFPDKIAVIFQDISYSYRELNYMANVVATELSKRKIRNSRITVVCRKSAWMIAGLLGIMKSGNAYIPVDSEYPEDRIRYIFKNSKCEFMFCTADLKDNFPKIKKIVFEDLDFNTFSIFPNLARPNSLAYMIYTSGTTGNPKGVEIRHRNIVNTLIWRKDFYHFDENIVVLQVPSFAFDSSVEDIFTPLISGSTLVIPDVTRMDVNVVAQTIEQYKVNHFLVVPSLYKVLLHEKLDSLASMRFVTIAGESFPMQLVKEHFKKLPDVRLINEYGPTENSVCSTFYELTKDDSTIFIGKPIYNTKCYCLDSNLNMVPMGCKGELYVSGPGVSDGYFENPSLTQKRFLKNPFHPKYCMYKTGDIVSFNFDGNLEFIGRDDGQVKLHGFRIELKSIEKNILKDKKVSDCVVMVRENSSGKDVLVAYITSYETNYDVSDLYARLKGFLPFYMLPIIIKVKAFPLTPNGKIDKKNLPLPEVQKTDNALPKNEIQYDILSVCQEVLANQDLGIYDDFFTAGGADSLSILSISSKLFAKGINVKTQDFYKYSCVEALEQYITRKKNSTQDSHSNMVRPMLTAFSDDFSKKSFKSLSFPYQNVLLTGANGFLGAHVLDYLLKNTNCTVSCIIREKYGQTPEKRLESILKFYFDNDYYQNYKSRIIIYNGELASEFFNLSSDDYSSLQSRTDCIINTAANTRHYGSYARFEKANVDTVKNLIAFAKPKNIIFNQMSTTNISGNYLVDNKISYQFTENDFYIGQNYEDNVYIHSKFEAEKLILEEEYKGLRANIFRLGNLMARFDDGSFQRNKLDNAYYSRLIALAKLGTLPRSLKDQKLEFTPVDEAAEAIVKLITIPNLKNQIFHIFSDRLIPIDTLLDVFRDYGFDCKFTGYNNFISNLHLQENEKILKYIISDLNQDKQFDYSSDIIIDQNITNQFLDFVGFDWSEIDADYLKRFFDKSNFIKDARIICYWFFLVM